MPETPSSPLLPSPRRAPSARLAACIPLLLLLLTALTLPRHAAAQDDLPTFQDEIYGQFDASARKFVALAEAMPAESYDWHPAPGVFTVARVFAHVSLYNYMYPDQNLGMDAPVAYADFEEELTEKGEVVDALSASMEYVRGVIRGMNQAEMASATRLYGREVTRSAVLLQLVTHMNEHLGQAIAYARMNGVVPPWSR